MKHWLIRWKYRLIVWCFDRPDSLARRVKVENRLLALHQAGLPCSPEECRQLAITLGVPRWRR